MNTTKIAAHQSGLAIPIRTDVKRRAREEKRRGCTCDACDAKAAERKQKDIRYMYVSAKNVERWDGYAGYEARWQNR